MDILIAVLAICGGIGILVLGMIVWAFVLILFLKMVLD